MTMTVNLAEARAQLASAEAAVEQQRRMDARKEIERIRRRGVEIRTELAPLVREVKEAERERLRLHYVIRECRAQVGYWSAPLDPAEFPDDETINAQARERKRWERKLVESEAAYHIAAQREGQRRHAIDLANELQSLSFQLANYKAVSEGRNPGELPKHGEVNVADANFLRVPGFTPNNEVFVPAATGGKRSLIDVWERLGG